MGRGRLGDPPTTTPLAPPRLHTHTHQAPARPPGPPPRTSSCTKATPAASRSNCNARCSASGMHSKLAAANPPPLVARGRPARGPSSSAAPSRGSSTSRWCRCRSRLGGGAAPPGAYKASRHTPPSSGVVHCTPAAKSSVAMAPGLQATPPKQPPPVPPSRYCACTNARPAACSSGSSSASAASAGGRASSPAGRYADPVWSSRRSSLRSAARVGSGSHARWAEM
jgi:hypothetical protein